MCQSVVTKRSEDGMEELIEILRKTRAQEMEKSD